jgi:transcriptional regulator with XRE-family HTH domain
MAAAGILIRRARQAGGLTQAELARRMGTTQSTVARLERTDANPTLDTLERALQAAGHRLALEAVPAAEPVDESQIRRHLAMTPAERIAAHAAAYRNTRRLLNRARLA